MATDAQIVSAAREVAAALAAFKKAEQAHLEASREVLDANTKVNDARKRLTEAETRLVNLSRVKVTEPVVALQPIEKLLVPSMQPYVPDMGCARDSGFPREVDVPAEVLAETYPAPKPAPKKTKDQPRIGTGG